MPIAIFSSPSNGVAGLEIVNRCIRIGINHETTRQRILNGLLMSDARP